MWGTVLAAVPWVELIKAAPKIAEETRKWYDSARGREPRRSSDGAPKGDSLPMLRADLKEVQERLDASESNEQAQAKLIDGMARHQAGLVRWVMALTVVAVLTSGAAIAALVIVVVG